jgi:hypothetical protein
MLDTRFFCTTVLTVWLSTCTVTGIVAFKVDGEGGGVDITVVPRGTQADPFQ